MDHVKPGGDNPCGPIGRIGILMKMSVNKQSWQQSLLRGSRFQPLGLMSGFQLMMGSCTWTRVCVLFLACVNLVNEFLTLLGSQKLSKVVGIALPAGTHALLAS